MTRDVHDRHIKGRRRHKRRVRNQLFLLIAAIILALAAFITVTAVKSIRHPVITIKAEPGEITLGEEIPELKASITGVEISDKKLSGMKKDYTVEKFFKDLKNHEWFKLSTEATKDSLEGSYLIQPKLDETISKKLAEGWEKKVKVVLENSSLTIKNPAGEWKGDKFQKYDGSFVTSDFVTYHNKSYYFDDKGVKATGLVTTAGDKIYYFDKNGVQQNGWQELDGAKYYLTSAGYAQIGWADIDGATYYFGSDGKMMTGEQKLGTLICKFDDDGKLISKEVAGVDPSKPMLALTFDDGPGARTGELLAALEKANAKATFFMLGQQVKTHMDDVKKMVEIGCEVANHSYDHPQLPKLSKDKIEYQINTTSDLIAQATGGTRPALLRPPYGAINDTVKQVAGMPLILWNVDTLDWKTRNTQSTIDSVMSNASDGDIILMHDIHTQSVDAALKLIPMLQEKGFQLVTVSEMAAAKNITLQAGQKYTDFN